MDFGAGTVWSIAQFAWNVYSKYVELGKQGRDVAADIRSMAEQLDSSFAFLQNHNEKLSTMLKERLMEASQKCRKTLKEADASVRDLKGVWRRTWLALILSDDIAALSIKLQRHRSELQAVNQDIDLLLSGWLAANIGEIVEAVRRLNGSQRVVSDREIPRSTPPFARQLLKDGAYVDTRNPATGHTALQDACEPSGDLRLVELLLREGADPAMATISSRVNAVHIAAFHDRTDALQTIKEYLYSAPDDVGDPYDKGKPDDEWEPVVVSKLRLREKSSRERRRANSKKWIALLQSTQVNGQTPLHLAAEGKSYDAVKFLTYELLDAGAGKAVNARDLRGRTPLHAAAAAGLKAVVRFLLREGAEPDVADETDKALTPLHLAAARDNAAVVKALLTGGARVDPRGGQGHTPWRRC